MGDPAYAFEFVHNKEKTFTSHQVQGYLARLMAGAHGKRVASGLERALEESQDREKGLTARVRELESALERQTLQSETAKRRNSTLSQRVQSLERDAAKLNELLRNQARILCAGSYGVLWCHQR